MTSQYKDAKTVEPEQPTLVLEHSEALEDLVVNARPDFPEPSVDETILDPSTVEPSSSANLSATYDSDVLITGSRFFEPGNPTVDGLRIVSSTDDSGGSI